MYSFTDDGGHIVNMIESNMQEILILSLLLLLLYQPLVTISQHTCTQPSIELDDGKDPFISTPALSYVFQVQGFVVIHSQNITNQVQRLGGGAQFCKVQCRSNGWRGPICADSSDTLTG